MADKEASFWSRYWWIVVGITVILSLVAVKYVPPLQGLLGLVPEDTPGDDGHSLKRYRLMNGSRVKQLLEARFHSDKDDTPDTFRPPMRSATTNTIVFQPPNVSLTDIRSVMVQLKIEGFRLDEMGQEQFVQPVDMVLPELGDFVDHYVVNVYESEDPAMPGCYVDQLVFYRPDGNGATDLRVMAASNFFGDDESMDAEQVLTVDQD